MQENRQTSLVPLLVTVTVKKLGVPGRNTKSSVLHCMLTCETDISLLETREKCFPVKNINEIDNKNEKKL